MTTTRQDQCRRAVEALPPGPYAIHRTRHLVHVIDARGELVATVDTRIPLGAQLRIAGALALLPGLLARVEQLEALRDRAEETLAEVLRADDLGDPTPVMEISRLLSDTRKARPGDLSDQLAALAPRADEARTCVDVRKVGPAFAVAEGAR